MMTIYEEWNPVDLRDYYISPGLIDCNVRVNCQWETVEEASRAAVAGGVTFMLVEDGMYGQEWTQTSMYCDVGELRCVTSLRDLSPSPQVFAYKIYRYAPSAFVGSYSDSFDALFSRVSEQGLPLFVDSSLPEQRMLILGSPYRHCSFEERRAGRPVDEASFNPGAYQDEGKAKQSSSESDDEDWVFMKPDRTKSSVEGFRSSGEQKPVPTHEPSHAKRFSKDLETLPEKPQTVLPTLIEDLDSRIRYHGGTESPLSQAELMGYNRAGKYVYSATIPEEESKRSEKKSLSVVPMRVEPMDAESSEREKPPVFSERVRLRRPATLVVKSVVPLDFSAQDRQYITHLANIPDHWESAGLAKVFKSLQKTDCRVHFVNMSTARAINEVRTFKEKFEKDVTVETCPHYLYFSMEEITPGDTRLKAYPPIRNKTNCNLLWELLKVKCIDVISSNHASLEPELKFLDTGNFKRALSGVNGLGCSLQAVWTKLRMPVVDSEAVRELYIMRLSKWLSLSPAKVLGIASKRGSIETGKYADLVVWQPHSTFTLDGAGFKYPDLNPYVGKSYYGQVHSVYVRGALAFQQNEAQPVGKSVARSNVPS